MDIIDLKDIEELPFLEESDLFHTMRMSENSVLLSYRVLGEKFKDIFQSVELLAKLNNEINALLEELNEVSSSMIKRNEAKELYASKDTFSVRKEKLLTKSNMDSIVSKYVTDDDMNSYSEQVITEAHKFADEITDFVGAAMVGINQTGSIAAPVEGATTTGGG